MSIGGLEFVSLAGGWLRVAAAGAQRQHAARKAAIGNISLATQLLLLTQFGGQRKSRKALARCCYNFCMTLMEITYELQSPLQPEQLRALGSFANTYGLRRFRVDEQANRLSFEYDASRLKETEVEHVLRQAKIPVLRRVAPVGTISQV
jgi:hypothetical protein